MLAQEDVESEIMRLSERCEQVTLQLAKRAIAAAEADAAFKVEYAKAYLVAEGTVPEREAHAAIATQGAYRDHRIAEARFKSAAEAGRNARTQLEALRSIAANLRALVSP
jgi:hypothetical protein